MSEQEGLVAPLMQAHDAYRRTWALLAGAFTLSDAASETPSCRPVASSQAPNPSTRAMAGAVRRPSSGTQSTRPPAPSWRTTRSDTAAARCTQRRQASTRCLRLTPNHSTPRLTARRSASPVRLAFRWVLQRSRPVALPQSPHGARTADHPARSEHRVRRGVQVVVVVHGPSMTDAGNACERSSTGPESTSLRECSQ